MKDEVVDAADDDDENTEDKTRDGDGDGFEDEQL